MILQDSICGEHRAFDEVRGLSAPAIPQLIVVKHSICAVASLISVSFVAIPRVTTLVV